VVGNRLTVVGTDLDLTVRVEIEAIGLDDGSSSRGPSAAEIVRSSNRGGHVRGGEDEVEISAARSRFVVLPLRRDFPVLPDPRPTRSSFRRQLRGLRQWCGPLPMTTLGPSDRRPGRR